MRCSVERQEFVTDVHSKHVHEADPWGYKALGLMHVRCIGCPRRRYAGGSDPSRQSPQL